MQAINVFCSLADESRQVPNLKGKKYADYKITEPEWEVLKLIREVLEVQQFFCVRLSHDDITFLL